jgi:hypothetical protein
VKKVGEPCTLYCKARILGYKRCGPALLCCRACPAQPLLPRSELKRTAVPGARRSKVNQYENQSLLKIEHVNSKTDTEFYMGKRCGTA